MIGKKILNSLYLLNPLTDVLYLDSCLIQRLLYLAQAESIKNGLNVFERGEKLLQNGIPYYTKCAGQEINANFEN